MQGLLPIAMAQQVHLATEVGDSMSTILSSWKMIRKSRAE